MSQPLQGLAKNGHERLKGYQSTGIPATPRYTSRQIHGKTGRNKVLGLPHPYLTKWFVQVCSCLTTTYHGYVVLNQLASYMLVFVSVN
jgi:hypothetical protein